MMLTLHKGGKVYMLIKLDILPHVLPDNLPDEARATREARVLRVRGKPVLATEGRKGLLLHDFQAWGL